MTAVYSHIYHVSLFKFVKRAL